METGGGKARGRGTGEGVMNVDEALRKIKDMGKIVLKLMHTSACNHHCL